MSCLKWCSLINCNWCVSLAIAYILALKFKELSHEDVNIIASILYPYSSGLVVVLLIIIMFAFSFVQKDARSGFCPTLLHLLLSWTSHCPTLHLLIMPDVVHLHQSSFCPRTSQFHMHRLLRLIVFVNPQNESICYSQN